MTFDEDGNLILSNMDYFKAAIINAVVEDLTVTDLWACVEHAQSAKDFDTAVNELIHITPEADTCPHS